jgi:hypothetical protein
LTHELPELKEPATSVVPGNSLLAQTVGTVALFMLEDQNGRGIAYWTSDEQLYGEINECR